MLILPETEECMKIKDIYFGRVFRYEGEICMRISNTCDAPPNARIVCLKNKPYTNVVRLDKIMSNVTFYPDATLHLGKGCFEEKL